MGSLSSIDDMSIDDQENSRNDNCRETHIKRSPHDKQNPYAQISRDLIRDENISPNCRWLLTYLLSNVDKWEIRVQQVVNHVKPHIGRNKVHELFKEAIDAGYMERQEILVPSKAGGKLKRLDYFVSESPIFKKCFRRPENQDPGDQHPGERTQSNSKGEGIAKESSSKSDPVVHNSEPIDPSPNAAAAPLLENGIKRAFVALPLEIQGKILEKFWKDNAKTPIKNTHGWFAKCIREEWWLEDSFEPPPPPEPESVVNKRENTKYAEHVIKKLECVQELDTGLTSDHLWIKHPDRPSDPLNLAEGIYEFRARVHKALRDLKLSPEIYLAETSEAKKENIPLTEDE